MKVALVIGHDINSQGAENKSLGLTEFRFNESLAFDIAKELTSLDIEHEIIYREEYKTLPEKINKTSPSLIISYLLHFEQFSLTLVGPERRHIKETRLVPTATALLLSNS